MVSGDLKSAREGSSMHLMHSANFPVGSSTATDQHLFQQGNVDVTLFK
jgi:hypothetical protein